MLARLRTSSLAARHRKSSEPKKSELVPVAPLEDDLIVDDVEESAAPEPERVAPFQNGPFAILENLLDDASHVGRSEFCLKHRADILAADNGLLRNLVIGRIVSIQC